jgi:prepilin-type N-terminal cleavage/methylation domain-containing protein
MKIVKNKKGFTLAEMMIVIAIIGIFSSMTIVNFRGNEKVREVDNQALLLLDGIKRIQTSSLSGRTIEGDTVSAYRFEINKCFSSGCSYSLLASTTPPMIVFDTVLLELSNIDIIDNAIPTNSIGDNLKVDIFPPRGNMDILIDGVSGNSEVILKIEHKDDSDIFKKIKINKISGRMDIVND